MLRLSVRTHAWKLKEPFAIARGVRTEARVVIVELREDGLVGLGEAGGVAYHGETPESMCEQIERLRSAVENGCSREELMWLLAPGGARHALDAALWDLQARRTGVPVWQRARVPHWRPVDSAVTIGMRSLADYEKSARAYAQFPWLKVKVGRDAPVEAIAAVRRGAPDAHLIVDANQSWTVAELEAHAPQLLVHRVDLIEQPVAAGEDAALVDYRGEIPLCADESFSTVDDLPMLAGRYRFINIKLDKIGGLTAALQAAAEAKARGFRLMVGCMLGGSVSVAPAMVLAQLCEVCDLDGPWLQAEDWPQGIEYDKGRMSLPAPGLWG